jgi:hypothetical protein
MHIFRASALLRNIHVSACMSSQALLLHVLCVIGSYIGLIVMLLPFGSAGLLRLMQTEDELAAVLAHEVSLPSSLCCASSNTLSERCRHV